MLVLTMVVRRKTVATPADASGNAWPVIGVLSEPRRREAYDFVAANDAPVTRDAVSTGLSMTRSLAAFHLDKLADAGLLSTSFSRPADRVSGPGAGRPSKLYAVSDLEVDVSIPPRRYDIAGRIMARAIAGFNGRSDGAAAAAQRIAREEGLGVGQQYTATGRKSRKKLLSTVKDALTVCGYEPRVNGATVLLSNCPYHALVDVAPKFVCELNESFVGGVLTGLGGDDVVEAELCGPMDGNCCVRIRAVGRAD
jgi:predicted ArsR family transcriptional regulator